VTVHRAAVEGTVDPGAQVQEIVARGTQRPTANDGRIEERRARWTDGPLRHNRSEEQLRWVARVGCRKTGSRDIRRTDLGTVREFASNRVGAT